MSFKSALNYFRIIFKQTSFQYHKYIYPKTLLTLTYKVELTLEHSLRNN